MNTREKKYRHWCPTEKEMTPHEEIKVLHDDTFADLFKPDKMGGFLIEYTGLKNTSDQEIYEGDVVELFGWGSQTESDGLTSIVWDTDESGWNFERYDYAEDRYDFRKAIGNCKVVGNIYENPELLKK